MTMHAPGRFVFASLVSLLTLLVLPAPTVPAAELRQVISREHPAFKGTGHGLALGRDGRVYLYGVEGNKGYVLRMSIDGRERFGGDTVYAITGVAANAQGVIATANAHFARAIHLYDAAITLVGKTPGFTGNDNVGWNAPGDVEAGASGDFYAIDQHMNRVLRINPRGQIVQAHPIDARAQAGRSPLRSTRFRVCEATGSLFYDTPAGIRCADFHGRTRWVIQANLSGNVYDTYRGDFDVDERGTLYVLAAEKPLVQKYDAQGTRVDAIALKMGEFGPTRDEPLSHLRVGQGTILVRRKSDVEMFQVFGMDGTPRHRVEIDHEQLLVRYPDPVWLAGQTMPLTIRLNTHKTEPMVRAWLRPLGTSEFTPLPVGAEGITVPHVSGLFHFRVTAGLGGAESEYLVQSVVEIRPRDSQGSISILTPFNRRSFGRGETIPFRVIYRGARGRPRHVELELRDSRNGVVWKKAMGPAENEENGTIPSQVLRAITPGRYRLTVNHPRWTVADQHLEIGAGLPATRPFHLTQYGDYNLSYPKVNFWNAPELIARHVEHARQLGLNMFVDRLGHGGSGALPELGQSLRENELFNRLKADPLAVAPEKAVFENRALQSIAAYGAQGIEQRAILLYMDAGLPVGTGHDKRPFDQCEKDIADVTSRLLSYPAFTGWSWAANWWIEARGARCARTPDEKAAYEMALDTARKTGAWDPVLERVSDVWINHAVEAQNRFRAAMERVVPGKLSAMTGPYRQPGILPPITFARADEVDLHWQAEQIQWPLISGHSVDFYKRPGRRAWAHPELWNDDGTGAQILTNQLFMVMRGADGVGQSGSTRGFKSPVADARGMGAGATSVHRALNRMLAEMGPWLGTLSPDDPVAIPVSTRMMRLGLEWKGIGDRYFTRLFEAYTACLFAHRPASFVFTEDCAADSLSKFRAVLVVDQEVELDPPLAKAIGEAAKKGVAVFADQTTRDGVVPGAKVVGLSFDRIEAMPHVWNDDSAFGRFRQIFLEHAPRLAAALDGAAPAIAQCDQPEVLLTQRQGKDVRVLWVLNHAAVPLDPGILWRVSLAATAQMPVMPAVKWNPGDGFDVYDLLARQKLEAGATWKLNLQTFPARVLVAVPAGAKLDQAVPVNPAVSEDQPGSRLRDIAIHPSGAVAAITAAGWDRNLLGVDLRDGTVRWQSRIGHHYAYAPHATAAGFTVQGYDLNSAEGYHLYQVNQAGHSQRRFSLFGLPKRGTGWANAKDFPDRINQFAAAPDGAWVASSGDLGLVVWDREGNPLWSQDWSATARRRMILLAANPQTLLTLERDTATAYDAASGKVRWQHQLRPTGVFVGAVADADGQTLALRSTANGGRIFILRDGKPTNVLQTAADEVALSPDGRHLATVKEERLKLYDTATGLKWKMAGDDILRGPRFALDNRRLAVGSEIGTLHVLDLKGDVLLKRDLGALPAVAWMSDGDLVAATWLGQITRLGSDFKTRWTTRIQPDATITASDLLKPEGIPASRVTSWGNAAPRVAALKPNLLETTKALINARCDPQAHGDPRQWQHPVDRLRDGDPAAPDQPWLQWTDINYIDSGWRQKLVVEVDAFRRQLRVTGVTIMEDPRHPESWTRDVRLQYWDAGASAWRDGPCLLSNAAAHTHWFERPIEAAKFRLVSTGGSTWPVGNLRWGELVFHGEELGPSHPDALANRPAAVLFDEHEDDLRAMMVRPDRPFAFKYDDAASGGKCIAMTAPGESQPDWRPPFGHVLPNWDFQIVEKPEKPGEYRWITFAWKALSPQTSGLWLRVGPSHAGGVALCAGEAGRMEGVKPIRHADTPPGQWQTLRVDLWALTGGKPFNIRSLSIGATGGGAAFDRILLGRNEADVK